MFSTLLRDLRSHAVNNIEYFQNGTTSSATLFHKSFCLLHEHLDRGIQPSIDEITPRLAEFDLSPDIKANGYRSLIKIVHRCCQSLLQLSRHITNHRTSMFFRSHHYTKELEAYVSVLGQLRASLHYANKLIPYCDPGDLFANEENLNNEIAENLLKEIERLSQDCFYGRCLGFQFCGSMVKPLQGVAVAMASFSDGYKNTSQLLQLTTTLLNSGKYLLDPDLRAQRVVDVTRTADISFCKSFWSITESDFMQLPHLACPRVHVNEVITINPGPFEMSCHNSVETVIITPPCAFTGPGEIKMRLISNHWRTGQTVPQTKVTKKPHPMSSGLVLHCHGGGFVAQSSRSHEVYLRQWAKDLDVPILSIDYSLAPEFPFPRALEECFYAYAWALENSEKLGWTGERICFAGDSAGGNLMMATAIRAASFQIRVPDGIMAAYTPFMVRYTPSPSRMLGLMDPLLPMGILTRCLAAYAGVSTSFSPKDDRWVVIEYKNREKPENETTETKKVDNSTMDALTSSSDSESNNGNEPSFEDVKIDNSDEKSDDFEVLSVTKDKFGSNESNMSQFSIEEIETEHGLYIGGPKSKKEGQTSDSEHHQTHMKGLDESQNVTENISLENGAIVDLPRSCSSDSQIISENVLSDCDQQITPESMSIQSGSQTMSENISGHSDGHKMFASFSDHSVFDSDKRIHKKLERVSRGCGSFDLPKGICDPEIPSKNACDRACSLNFVPLQASKDHILHSPLTAFRHLPIVKNPYMSPLLADDELLKDLPPVYLVACHLDPLLDDSIMFAKKLRSLNKKVDLHLVDDLPHGFLNFSLVTKEARLASDICISKIMSVLG